jgi:hypothetical protein
MDGSVRRAGSPEVPQLEFFSERSVTSWGYAAVEELLEGLGEVGLKAYGERVGFADLFLQLCFGSSLWRLGRI